MRCRECASENSELNPYCETCGAGLIVECPGCGHRGNPGAAFCGRCGIRIEPGTGNAAGGERKQATVIFADIVGSTGLIAALDAEDAMGRLNPAMAAMVQVIRRFDGTVLRTLGDGLKAAFGALRAQEGHALLACRAATAMQEAVAALDHAPQVRIGLHSGEVVAGEFETGAELECDAKGVTVHLASRIEQLAEPGSICLSGECHRLVAAYCDTAPVGVHSLKGFPHPVEPLAGAAEPIGEQVVRL